MLFFKRICHSEPAPQSICAASAVEHAAWIPDLVRDDSRSWDDNNLAKSQIIAQAATAMLALLK